MISGKLAQQLADRLGPLPASSCQFENTDGINTSLEDNADQA